MAIEDTTGIAEQLGWILALKDSDKGLADAWDAYLKGDTAGFKAAVLGSDFYRNNNALSRQRLTAQANQPGVAKSDLEAYVSKTKDRLIQSGVQWNAGVQKQVEDGYYKGMSDSQLDDMIAASGKLTVSGGATLSTIDSVKSIANQFGVANLLDNNYWDAKSTALFAGDTTTADIEKEIKDLAASAYPAYADGISKGISLTAQASNVIQSVAKYLELDPNTVTLDDPRVRRIVQYVDPTTKQPARMPQWLVEKTVKSDPAWAYTNNARDTVDSLYLKVGRDWGIL